MNLDEKLKGIEELAKLPDRKKDYGNSWKMYALALEARLKTIRKAAEKEEIKQGVLF